MAPVEAGDTSAAIDFQVCASCFKTPGAGAKLLVCSGCRKAGRVVSYCSPECQMEDYRRGKPPHRQICSEQFPTSPALQLYTSTPSVALSIQLICLRRDLKWDYHFTRRPDGIAWEKEFYGDYKRIFQETKKRAMETQDKASIAMMEAVLQINAGECDTSSLWTEQLEAEYEVRMDQCRIAAKEAGGKDWEYLEGVLEMVQKRRAAYVKEADDV